MSDNGVISRPSKVEFVALGKMSVSPVSQRSKRSHRVDNLLANFDPEKLGMITVNHRDDRYWIVDGQHRYWALREWLGEGWEEQQVECLVYRGLSESEEADLWLYLNDTLAVKHIDKFWLAFEAAEANPSRRWAVEIAATAERADIPISRPGVTRDGLRCTGTLERIHGRAGHKVLYRTLVMAESAWGDVGLRATPLDGLSRVVDRYDGALDDDRLVGALQKTRGGFHGLMAKAEERRQKMRKAKAACIAATIVEAYNRKRGKNLPRWWAE